MIFGKLNLACEDDHMHWAPHPEYWEGGECLKPLGLAICRKLLRTITASERTDILRERETPLAGSFEAAA